MNDWYKPHSTESICFEKNLTFEAGKKKFTSYTINREVLCIGLGIG
jgi:hypothetical protein